MQMMSSIRAISIAVVASLALPSGAALALEAHEEAGTGSEENSGTKVEFLVGGVTVSAQLPCEEPQPGPPGPEGLQTSACFVGDQMFILASSEGAATNAAGPMPSDFDAAYAEIETSHDTSSIEEVEIDGRRTMRALRGPEPAYGVMQAVQVAPDALVYVITMSRPNGSEPLPEAEKKLMHDFVDSLEVAQ